MNLQGWLNSVRNEMRKDTGINGDAQRIEQLGWMLFYKIFCDKDSELQLTHGAKHVSPIPKGFHWNDWAANDEGITGDPLLDFVDNKLFRKLRNLDVAGNSRAVLLRDVFIGNNNYLKSGNILRAVLNKINEINFNIAKTRHAFGELYEGMLGELQSAGKSGEFYTPRPVTKFIVEMVAPKLGEKTLDPACGTGGFLTAAVDRLAKECQTTKDRRNLMEGVMGIEYKPLPHLLATTNMILHDISEPNIRLMDALGRDYHSITQKDRVDCILANPPFGGVVADGVETNFPGTFRTKESADLFLVLMIQLLKNGGRAGIVLPDGSLTGEGVKQRVREELLTKCKLHTIIRLPNSVFQPYATVATNLLFFEKGVTTKEVWYYEHRLPEGQKSYSKTKPIRLEEFNPIRKWWNKRKESDVCWRVTMKTIRERGFDLDIKNPNREQEEIPHTTEELLDLMKKSFAHCDTLIDKIKASLGGRS